MKTLIFFFVLTFVYSDNTIAIIGTNDIHGTAFPKSLVREDTGEQYSYGGLVYMGRLI